ncbi:flagellar protein FlaG [Desulforamulus ferrireducens]|uniref:Uncharacterized protein n=1 Tax=Desulforamulus ferrireducens TaxID=1833852 RepID=A0A1S6IYK8_9FIRM|nr:flagellar protein FlaG [Desulforamulus ferrireducens]AQS59846.1 hypothetical protein B0537_12585 [Desulforamulus ferrireducens]
MKIGAGGLQNLIAQEIATKFSDFANRVKPLPDPVDMQAQEVCKKLLSAKDLNKAVEHLNQLAKMFNLGIEFKLVKDSKPPKVKLKARDGREIELSPEEVEELLNKAEPQKGNELDRYA